MSATPPHSPYLSLSPSVELLSLLKWRQKSQNLSVVLKNLDLVGGQEVVKFLQVMSSLLYLEHSITIFTTQDTLDCLFEILNDSNEKYGELVFEALVGVVSRQPDML